MNRCPKVDFFCNRANIPTVSLGSAVQSSYLKNIPVPGDKLEYEDLQLDFMVDENCENYLQIYDWITGLGFPESLQQYQELKRDRRFWLPEDALTNERSDGTLMILNNNYLPSLKVIFKDLFPVSLSGIPFSAVETEERYFTATVSFKYTIYDVIDVNGKKV